MIQTQSRGNKIYSLKSAIFECRKWRLLSHKNRLIFLFFLNYSWMSKGRIRLNAQKTEAILFLYKMSCCMTVKGALVLSLQVNRTWLDTKSGPDEAGSASTVLFLPFLQTSDHWFCILMQRCRKKIRFVKCQLQRTIVHRDITGWFSEKIWKG